MTINDLLRELRQELRAQTDSTYRNGVKRFFVEPVKVLGVRTPLVRSLARKYGSRIRTCEQNVVFQFCENLLDSGWYEEALIAFAWAGRMKKSFEEVDFKRWEKWVNRHITNWALCDDFCARVFGPFLERFPKFLPRVKSWACSKNKWMRRVSAVSLIVPLRHGLYLQPALEIADILLQDEEDLVQKGYGWMLKEAGAHFQKEVFAFVLAHKKIMPRTALRYAIEKYPPKMRTRAMS